MSLWITDTAEYDTAYGMRYASEFDGRYFDETTEPDPAVDADWDDEYREEER